MDSLAVPVLVSVISAVALAVGLYDKDGTMLPAGLRLISRGNSDNSGNSGNSKRANSSSSNSISASSKNNGSNGNSGRGTSNGADKNSQD